MPPHASRSVKFTSSIVDIAEHIGDLVYKRDFPLGKMKYDESIGMERMDRTQS